MNKTTYLKDYKVPPYLIEKVLLEFHLGESFTSVKSQLTICANPQNKVSQANLILDGEALELISISLDGKILTENDYQKNENSLTIFQVPAQFDLNIETRIKPQENTGLSGLYQSSGNFCTQCEAHGFRRITYYIDRPDVMAKFTTTIMADEKKYPILLSNGNLIEQKKIADEQHIAVWEDPFKKPCYLFALVAGDLEWIEDFFMTQSGRKITLKIFVEKGNQDKAHHAMNAVKKAMRWDEEKFGREYDLTIYMIVAVSDFNMGAMENKGLNIFNTQYILAKPDTATDADYIHVESVIAHEYFHNWTGNRITCRDWFQLSLKEGLTVFRDQSFTEDTTSQTVARINDVNDLRSSQFAEDAGPLAHPVRPDHYEEINNFYTATVYNKGAEVIRMQKTILGDALFRKGMDLYFERHDGQAVTIEDFVKCMEDASQIDLTQFRLWYSQAGTPALNIEDQYDANQQIYTLKIKQTLAPTPNQPEKKPMHIPVKIGLLDENGKEISEDLLQIKKSEETFQFNHIKTKPIPSLLRDFSAPVKLNYHYTDEDLLFLFKNDTNLFNRWEAGQQYAVNLILRLIQDYRDKKIMIVPDDFIFTFSHHLKTCSKSDKLLLTQMLTLPNEKYLAEFMPVIDVEGIHVVREFIMIVIAKKSKELLLETYYQNHDNNSVYEFNIREMGKRQIKNLCLDYLMLLNDAQIDEELGLHQFKNSIGNNMTDTIAALKSFANSMSQHRQNILDTFYDHYRTDALVVDKWLSIQATSKLSDTLKDVRQLMHHEAFTIKNPNKVYALIGAFGHRNPIRFHADDGEGYAFLADCVIQLDPINPQIAARMIKPLLDWKRYDENRQSLMKKYLTMILQKTKSKDVAELVTKSL